MRASRNFRAPAIGSGSPLWRLRSQRLRCLSSPLVEGSLRAQVLTHLWGTPCGALGALVVQHLLAANVGHNRWKSKFLPFCQKNLTIHHEFPLNKVVRHGMPWVAPSAKVSLRWFSGELLLRTPTLSLSSAAGLQQSDGPRSEGSEMIWGSLRGEYEEVRLTWSIHDNNLLQLLDFRIFCVFLVRLW